MNAGFISPSFRSLEMLWQDDFEMVKLGVPTFMGFFYRAGHHDIAHWDFDAQICVALEQDPNAFDLTRYFDAVAVKGFLTGTDSSLRAQTEKLLDTLGVREREIFGISLSAVQDKIAHVVANAALGQCMALVLKERYPNCTIVFGGIQASPDSIHERYYRQFMEECPQIDYCRIGWGDETAVQLFRNIWRGTPEANHVLHNVLYRDIPGTGSIRMGKPPNEGMRLDSDLRPSQGTSQSADWRHGPSKSEQLHHRAHTKSGALAQSESAIIAATALAGTTLPASSLVRRNAATIRYDETHHPDGTEISAIEADPVDYSTIPARVPIFDPNLVDQFRYTGVQIMKRFRFDEEMLLRFSRHENDKIVVLPHIFVRGCNAPCGFCGDAYNPIKGEDIIQTVEGLKFLSETYNCKHFHFLNTQINSVYQYGEAFCDAVIAAKLDILWSDCCNLRFLDESLLEKLRRAGAMRLVFGVESPEDEMLKYIHKGVTVAKIERLLKASHDLGIWNHILLIAGMPHETKSKHDRIIEFFHRTAPHVDYYTVSSFYLLSTSPWGKDPDRFGIDRISSPEQLLENQAFHEKSDGRWESDNLRWPEKKQQIIDATKLFYGVISEAKGQTRCTSGNIDLYLLMFLYSTLGHDRKKDITDIYLKTAGSVYPSAGQTAASPESVTINVPVVVRRMNEADQSSLLQVPITLEVSARSEGKSHFFASERYTYAYRTPRLPDDGQRISQNARVAVQETLQSEVGRLVTQVKHVAQSLDRRYAPPVAAAMAEILAATLPRYRPFTDAGFTVVGRMKGRSIQDRMIEWSGVRC